MPYNLRIINYDRKTNVAEQFHQKKKSIAASRQESDQLIQIGLMVYNF